MNKPRDKSHILKNATEKTSQTTHQPICHREVNRDQGSRGEIESGPPRNPTYHLIRMSDSQWENDGRRANVLLPEVPLQSCIWEWKTSLVALPHSPRPRGSMGSIEYPQTSTFQRLRRERATNYYKESRGGPIATKNAPIDFNGRRGCFPTPKAAK